MKLLENKLFKLTPVVKEYKDTVCVQLKIDTPSETIDLQFFIEPQDVKVFLFEYVLFQQEVKHHELDFGYFIEEGNDEHQAEEDGAFLWLEQYPLTESWNHECMLDPISEIKLTYLTYLDGEESIYTVEPDFKEIEEYVKLHLGECLKWSDVMQGAKRLSEKYQLEQTVISGAIEGVSNRGNSRKI